MLNDEGYTYDHVGNRLTSTDVSGSWGYNLNNELLGYADVAYDYDDNGNLTQVSIAGSPVWTYSYDAANRLIHAEDGTGSISATITTRLAAGYGRTWAEPKPTSSIPKKA